MALILDKDLVGKKIQGLKEDAYRCSFDCFNCTTFSPEYLPCCPAFEKYKFFTYASRGRAGLIEAYLAGNIKMTKQLAEIMYSCSLCGACRVCCQQDWSDFNLECFLAMREECIEKGFVAPKLRDALKNIYVNGNPYGISGEMRADWTDGSGVARYAGQEYLLFIGDEGSFDTEGQKMAKSLVAVLEKAGVSFGILGEKEISDGHEVKMAGEFGLYDYLIEQNLELFKELGVKKIVTLSPHSYNALKHDYPNYGGDFEVVHYTTLLKELIDAGTLKPSIPVNKKVAYHDPCFLGRFNDDYEVPREVIQSIPGVELIPLPREGEKAFCCGGGGANMFTDLLSGGEDAANRIRIREIRDVGAEVVVVSCPICGIMFDDAIKIEELEGKLELMDVSQLLLSSLP